MSMENIAGARKPAKREDEHTVAGEHRMMRRADREVTDPEQMPRLSPLATSSKWHMRMLRAWPSCR